MRVAPRQYVQLLVRQPAPGLPMTARAVAHVVASFADFDTGDNAYPSLSTIAAGAGVSRRCAIDQVNALVKAGWLARERPTVEASRRHQTTRYVLTVPDQVVRAVAPDLVRDVALGSAGRRTRSSERDDARLVRGGAPNLVKDHARTRERAPKQRLPWCGQCDEQRRVIEHPDVDEGRPQLCPRCNWRAAQ